jgi:hypothetical protein
MPQLRAAQRSVERKRAGGNRVSHRLYAAREELPSDAEVDKVISFLERVWRRLIEMGRSVQKDIERKN